MIRSDTVRTTLAAVKRCPTCGTRFGEGAAFCPFDGHALTPATWDKSGDPLTGQRVDGRYEVLEPLGEGGMGTVYRVRHVTLDRLFAMKVLRRDLADDGELAQRFVREAKATAAVKHPGVVAITDFGELDDRTPYFVMELLVGETLATRIRARGPTSAEEAIEVGRRIADALEASHAAGVVHRDLKPENVFLVGKSLGRAPEEDIRVVDFGAARVVGASRLTRPGVVFGTPYYMSPEQAAGQPASSRADIYSLGVLLFEMVTGSLPFQAETYMGVLTKHMFAEPPRPSTRISSGRQLGALEDVIMRCLSKDPSARYASMAELSTALAAARKPSAVMRAATQKLGHLAAPSPTRADRIQHALEQRHAEEQRRKRTYVAVGAFAATGTLLLGISALWVSQVAGARAEGRPPSVATASALPSSAFVRPNPSSAAPAPASAETSAAQPHEPSTDDSAAATMTATSATTAVPTAKTTATARAVSRSTGRNGPSTGASPAAAPSPARRPLPSDEFPDPWKR